MVLTKRKSSYSYSEEEGSKKIKKEAQAVRIPLKDIAVVDAHLPAIQGCRNIESFQLRKKIAEGTFGVQAKDKTTGEIVALKRLKMGNENEGIPVGSLREIDLLKKAEHSNIVSLKEVVVGTSIIDTYIVMDFIERDLASVMKKMQHPFSIGEVKNLMIQLLSGVAYLHSELILHRDLKPSNLLVDKYGILKIADFGLAREFLEPLKPYTPLVVTLWYRSPELLLLKPGEKIEYGPEIDIWSVGCIFGELISNKPLFPGKCEIDQLKKICKDSAELSSACLLMIGHHGRNIPFLVSICS